MSNEVPTGNVKSINHEGHEGARRNTYEHSVSNLDGKLLRNLPVANEPRHFEHGVYFGFLGECSSG